MLRLFKQIILILVAAGFIWNICIFVDPASSGIKSEFSSEEFSEKEKFEEESEDFKFFTRNKESAGKLKLPRQFANKESMKFPKYFSEVPTSPPNI